MQPTPRDDEEERAATAVALEEAQGQAEQASATEQVARDALEAERLATGGWVGSGNSHGHSHEYDRDCC